MKSGIRIGVSTCLLGEKVRYDGGHKLDHFIADTLGPLVEYVPVCPEYEAGFGIPREALRLVGDPAAPRLVTQKTGLDVTERMQAWIGPKLRDLEGLDLCGFIFKSRSPSSGIERVKVYDEKGNARKTGSGLFAAAFMRRFPLVPVEEEGRLNDVHLRENFIVRVFAFRRWKDLLEGKAGRGEIVAFHGRHKYLLMAHSPPLLKKLGSLVAGVKGMPRGEFIARYETLFMDALRQRATVRKNVNVLSHMAGYFKKVLDPREKEELRDIIERYGREEVPLIVPVTLVRHFVRRYGVEYLEGQYYLEPHPAELKLRNHA